MKVASHPLPALVDSMVALTPGTPAAEQTQHAIEGILMNALNSGGREAGEKLVESLVAHGHALERLKALPCMWRVAIPLPPVLEIWFTGGDNPVVAAVSYRVGEPWGTKAQTRAAKLQAEFYRRYELVALREANKGAARAREALACLAAIGAKRSTRWLTSALEGRLGQDGLARLDQQFNEKAEDLASLAMAYLGRSK